jgi:hypothetical protein
LKIVARQRETKGTVVKLLVLKVQRNLREDERRGEYRVGPRVVCVLVQY